jgi:TonB family protein
MEQAQDSGAAAGPEEEEKLEFLVRLGLTPQTDEREIKRAYARELRKIDPETDPAAFQALREARDTAQSWLHYQVWLREQKEQEAAQQAQETQPAGQGQEAQQGQGAQQAQEAGQAPSQGMAAQGQGAQAQGQAPATPAAADARQAAAAEGAPPQAAATPPDGAAPQAGVTLPEASAEPAPHELAEAVFAQLYEGLAGKVVPLEQARDLLDRCLDDDRLVFIEAKELFEFLIVHNLAQGWRLGHEMLFEVSFRRFGWDQDRRRLSRYGRAGAVLERAMEEFSAYEAQDDETRDAQRAVMRSLRFSEKPEGANYTAQVARAGQFVGRFPCLAGVVTSLDNFERWRGNPTHGGTYADSAVPVTARFIPRPAPSRATRFSENFIELCKLLGMIGAFMGGVLLLLLWANWNSPTPPLAPTDKPLSTAPAPRGLDADKPLFQMPPARPPGYSSESLNWQNSSVVQRGSAAQPQAKAAPKDSPRTVTHVDYVRQPRPVYPADSRREGEQGRVELRVLVSVSGRADRVEIIKSSGFARLDDAARMAVTVAQFKPYAENGKPEPVFVTIPVVFTLQN